MNYEQPAFPNPRWEGWGTPEQGMTLRDYFAAKAILYTIDYNDTYEEAADSAYMMADAMLKARTK
jgi:hypothetical protein